MVPVCDKENRSSSSSLGLNRFGSSGTLKTASSSFLIALGMCSITSRALRTTSSSSTVFDRFIVSNDSTENDVSRLRFVDALSCSPARCAGGLRGVGSSGRGARVACDGGSGRTRAAKMRSSFGDVLDVEGRDLSPAAS